MSGRPGEIYRDEFLTLYNDGKENFQSFEIDIEVVEEDISVHIWGFGADSFEACSEGLKNCEKLMKTLEEIKHRLMRLKDESTH